MHCIIQLLLQAKILEGCEEDPLMIQTGTGKKNQLPLACLLDLVNVVQLIFLKAKFSFITKQELVHKIIWHSSDITDKSMITVGGLVYYLCIFAYLL